MGGLFYLTFSLNFSKTIIFDIFLDLPLLNDEYEYFFEGEKGLGPTGPRFAPVCIILSILKDGRKRAPQGGLPYDVLLQWVNILKCFSFFLSIVQKMYLTQPLNHFENSNRSLQFS